MYINRNILTIHLKMTEVWSKRRVLPFILILLSNGYEIVTDKGNCEEQLLSPTVGRLLVICRPTVGNLSADCRRSAGRLLADSWPTVDQHLTDS